MNARTIRVCVLALMLSPLMSLAQSTFELSLPTISSGDAVATTPSNDGNLLMLTTDVNTGIVVQVLTKMTPAGTILWQKEISLATDLYIGSITPTNDGGCLTTANNYSGGSKSTVIRVDASGNVMWSNEIGSQATYTWAAKAIETSTGNVLVLTKPQTNNGPQEWPHLVMFDSLGSMLWTKEYIPPIAFRLVESVDLVEVNSNQYIVLGESRSSFLDDIDVSLMAVDSMGTMLWSQEYGGPDNDEPERLLFNAPSGLVVVGQTQSYGAGDYDLFVLKVNTNNQVGDLTVYASAEDDFAHGATIDWDQNLYIQGAYRDDSWNDFAFITKIRPDKSTAWAYYKTDESIGRTIHITPDSMLYAGFEETIGINYVGTVRKMATTGSHPCAVLADTSWNIQTYQPHQIYMPLDTVTFIDTASVAINSAPLTPSITASCYPTCTVLADFSISSTQICLGNTVSLQNNSLNGTSFEWWIADTLFSTATDTSVLFLTPGIHEVSLVAGDGICTDTATQLVEVMPPPTAGFNIVTEFTEVFFHNTSQYAASLQWDLGDGNASSLDTVRHVYADNTSYSVCLTATNVCGVDILCQPVVTFDTINAQFKRTSGPTMSSQQWPKKVIQTADGGYVVVGHEDYYGSSDNDFLLAKFNAKGEPLWNHALVEPLDQNSYCLVETHEGEFMIGGENEGFSEAVIINADSTGTAKWVRTFTGSNGVLDVVRSYDGNYLFTGDQGGKMIIIKISQHGDVIWTRKYSAGKNGMSIIEDDNRNILVTGEALSSTSSYVMKADSTGAIIWSKNVSLGGATNSRDILQTQDGNYVISGHTNGSGQGNYDLFLAKIDTAGNEMWTNTYGGSGADYNHGVDEDRFGNLFTMGAQTWRPLIVKTTANGNMIWSYRYYTDFFITHNANNPIVTMDNGVLIAGYQNYGGLSHISLMKADSAGNNCIQWPVGITQGAAIGVWNNNGLDSLMNYNPTAGSPWYSTGVMNLNDSVICYFDSSCVITANFGSSANLNTISFTDSTLNSSAWYWDFGDGTTSTMQHPVHTYGSTGTFNVCLIAYSSCASDTFCSNMTITCVVPVSGFNHGATNYTVNFTNTSANGTSWLWDFGDGNTSTSQNPSHVYANTGTYTVCLVSTNACGTDTICDTINVTCPPPTTGFSESSTDLTVSFTDNSNDNGSAITSWSWDLGDGNTSTQPNPTHVYAAPGTYSVCLVTTNFCGTDSICQNVVVTCTPPSPAFQFTDTLFTVYFTDISSSGFPITGWLWDFGDGNTSTQQNPTHVYATPGTYLVCLTVTSMCGSTPTCITVTVSCPVPAAGFTSVENFLQVTFTDASTSNQGIQSWQWDFGDGNTSSVQNPTHTYAIGGSYTTCLTVTDTCGSDSSCTTITVIPDGIAEHLDQQIVLYPNPAHTAFTLNWPVGMELNQLEILSVDGKLVLQRATQSETGSIMITVSLLAPGNYWVRGYTDHGVFGRRLVIVR